MKPRKICFVLLTIIFLTGCTKSDSISEKEELQLQPVTWEVILFEFTPDTGNNSSRLRYEIKFTNPNPVDITGYYSLKMRSEDLEWTSFSFNTSPCYAIAAESDCTISFDEEDSFEVGRVDFIELLEVEYRIETPSSE